MKYKEPKILLDVRKIKEQVHEKMEHEGTEAFLARINRRAGKPSIALKPKFSKKSR